MSTIQKSSDQKAKLAGATSDSSILESSTSTVGDPLPQNKSNNGASVGLEEIEKDIEGKSLSRISFE
jgi:hypothetical protein